jgi:hypothetical protein
VASSSRPSSRAPISRSDLFIVTVAAQLLAGVQVRFDLGLRDDLLPELDSGFPGEKTGLALCFLPA